MRTVFKNARKLAVRAPLLLLAYCASPTPPDYRIVAQAKNGTDSLVCEIVDGQPLLSIAESKEGFLEAATPMADNRDDIAVAFSSRTKKPGAPIYGGFQIKTGEVNVGKNGVSPITLGIAKKQYDEAMKFVTECRVLSTNPTASSEYDIIRYQPLDSEMRAAAIGAITRLTEYAEKIIRQPDSLQISGAAPG